MAEREREEGAQLVGLRVFGLVSRAAGWPRRGSEQAREGKAGPVGSAAHFFFNII
jgi:hypothetical protein